MYNIWRFSVGLKAAILGTLILIAVKLGDIANALSACGALKMTYDFSGLKGEERQQCINERVADVDHLVQIYLNLQDHLHDVVTANPGIAAIAHDLLVVCADMLGDLPESRLMWKLVQEFDPDPVEIPFTKEWRLAHACAWNGVNKKTEESK